MKTVRCAIYTRKSSEEGLEQGFNSLDAQREACAAYILSQASEGWVEVAEHYDDGGLSGGTLERPALQRLLSEVNAGRIDIIVVYKVDRLTRSLLDFSRLVEAFDAAGTSFVSITQSFNTTTSMGRLTLNMLLSFAQFEREVTAERIRDKIAASKAKGMWMGGIPPIGYAPDGRTLKIVEHEAALVRDIFQRYRALGNVRLVEEALIRDRVTSPARTTNTGKAIGGAPFSRGQIHKMLTNPIYIGIIAHSEQRYPALHAAIIDQSVWVQTQALFDENRQGAQTRTRIAKPSLLAGKLTDEANEPLIAVHANKGRTRYRYYVSRALHHATSDTGMRIPAREIETAVTEHIATWLDDPLALSANARLIAEPRDFAVYSDRVHALVADVRKHDLLVVRALVDRVQIERSWICITLRAAAIAERAGTDIADDAPDTIVLTSEVRLTRSGHVMRLVDDRGAAPAAAPNPALVRLLAKAHVWWGEMRNGEADVSAIAKREGLCTSYVSRVTRLAFLSPQVTSAILTGRQRDGIDRATLTAPDAIDLSWRVQAERFPGLSGFSCVGGHSG
jgi:DNA invertase Pin-like site-specific DNA recombinase